MTSCTKCKNAGCCPLWKSEKIDMRADFECRGSINYCLQMATLINRGEDLAVNCEKFQKNINFV